MSLCLALYLIIAWRILYMTIASHHHPARSCEIAFDKQEWHTIFLLLKKATPPPVPPNLTTMVHMLAQLGGFLSRKNDGEPGPKALSIGLQRIKNGMMLK